MTLPHESLRDTNRNLARDLVLDAAERILERSRPADFSMRELASEAKVSFATPFNLFGSKGAIMYALSSRLIEAMEIRFAKLPREKSSIDRVVQMGRVASRLLLEKPEVSKTVVAALSTPEVAGPHVHSTSTRLWLSALGGTEELPSRAKSVGAQVLAEQLAYSFRGCVSFWIAGELPDHEFSMIVERSILFLLLGIAPERERAEILRVLPKLKARG